MKVSPVSPPRFAPLVVACWCVFAQGVESAPLSGATAGWSAQGDTLVAQTTNALTPPQGTTITVPNTTLTIKSEVAGTDPLTLPFATTNTALNTPRVRFDDYLAGTPYANARPYAIKVGENRTLTLELPGRDMRLEGGPVTAVEVGQNASVVMDVNALTVGTPSPITMPTTPWTEPVTLSTSTDAVTVQTGTAHWTPDTFVLNAGANLHIKGDVALNNAGTLYLLAPTTTTSHPTLTIDGGATLNVDSQNLNTSAWVGSNGANLTIEKGLTVRGIARSGTVVYASPVKMTDTAIHRKERDRGARIVPMAGLRATNDANVTIHDHLDLESLSAGPTRGVDINRHSVVTLENLTLTVAGPETTGFWVDDFGKLTVEGDHLTAKVAAKALSQEHTTVTGATGLLASYSADVKWLTPLGDQRLQVTTTDGPITGIKVDGEAKFASTARDFTLSVESAAASNHKDNSTIALQAKSKNAVQVDAESITLEGTTLNAPLDTLRGQGALTLNAQDSLSLRATSTGTANKRIAAAYLSGFNIPYTFSGRSLNFSAENAMGKAFAFNTQDKNTVTLTGIESITFNAQTEKTQSLATALYMDHGTVTLTAPTVALSADGHRAEGINLQNGTLTTDADTLTLTTHGIQSAKGAYAMALAGAVNLVAKDRLLVTATAQNTAYGVQQKSQIPVLVKAPTIELSSTASGQTGEPFAYGAATSAAGKNSEYIGTLTIEAEKTADIKAESFYAIGLNANRGTLTLKGGNATLTATSSNAGFPADKAHRAEAKGTATPFGGTLVIENNALTINATADGKKAKASALSNGSGTTTATVTTTVNLTATALEGDAYGLTNDLKTGNASVTAPTVSLTTTGKNAQGISQYGQTMTVNTDTLTLTTTGDSKAHGIFAGNTAGTTTVTATQTLTNTVTSMTATGLEVASPGALTLKAPTVMFDVSSVKSNFNAYAAGIATVKTASDIVLDGDLTVKAHALKARGIHANGGALTLKGPHIRFETVGDRTGRKTTDPVSAIGFTAMSDTLISMESPTVVSVTEARGPNATAYGTDFLSGGLAVSPDTDLTLFAKAQDGTARALNLTYAGKADLEGKRHQFVMMSADTTPEAAAIYLDEKRYVELTIGTPNTKKNRVMALTFDDTVTDFSQPFESYANQKHGYALVSHTSRAVTFHGDATEIIGDGEIHHSKVQIRDPVANRWYGDVALDKGAKLAFNSTSDEGLTAWSGNLTARDNATGSLILEGTADKPIHLDGTFRDRAHRQADGTADVSTGSLDLTLENATWTPTDRSAIHHLTGTNSALIDLEHHHVKGLFIGELTGTSTFKLDLNAANRKESGLLYLGNNQADVKLDLGDITRLDLAKLATSPLRVASVKTGNALTLTTPLQDTANYAFEFKAITSTDPDALAANSTYAASIETHRFNADEVTNLMGTDPITHWVLTATRKTPLAPTYLEAKADVDAAEHALENATDADRAQRETERDAALTVLATSTLTAEDLFMVDERVTQNTDALPGLDAPKAAAIDAQTREVEALRDDMQTLTETVDQHDQTMLQTENTLATVETLSTAQAQRIQTNTQLAKAQEQRIAALTLTGNGSGKALYRFNRRLTESREKLHRGLAMNAALSGLFKPYRTEHVNVTFSFGGYQSEHALALGMGYRFTPRWAVSLGVATSLNSTQHVQGRVSVNVRF